MFLKALNVLVIAVEVLLIFNLIIIVHELGHFLAARWRGLVVDEFGIWFGKPLWRKKISGVWYSLGSIPAGGFVKLPQMAPMETLEGESDVPREQLPPITPLSKIIVAIAGPLFSFMLALALGTLVWAVGKPTSQADRPLIGDVLPGGPADQAGLKPGDKILAIDGNPVKRFSGPINSVMWNIARSEGEKIDFLIERDGKQQHILSGWTKEETAGWRRQPMRKVMLGPRYVPEVAGVVAGGAAEKAGLKEGDFITSANGTSIYSLPTLIDMVQKAPKAPIALVYTRGTEQIQTTLTPQEVTEDGQTGPDLGIVFDRLILDHPTPITQVVDSVHAIGNMLGALFSPKSDVKLQHFSGPVGIMRVYYQMFDSDEGWRYALAFSVFFNVNLALLNMLPFPVLDGGHITLAVIESVRRKPVNTRALEIVQTACAMALIAFMLYVSFFDLGDILPAKDRPAAIATPAPK